MSGESPTRAGARRPSRRVDLSRPSDRAAMVAVVIAVLLSLLIWSPSVGGHGPGDPSAVAADARLVRCGGEVSDVEFAFAIPHARDYRQYLPAMDRASELELDRPALVVVYRGEFPGVVATSAATAPPATGTARNVCIYVGPAGQGELNYFSEISVAGLRATPDGPVLVPAPQT